MHGQLGNPVPAQSIVTRRPRKRGTQQHLTQAIAGVMPRVEPLECRRMLSAAINGSVTLDESAGLQTGGIAVPGEDNNDSDVALNQLPTTFSNRLFGAPGGGLGL